MERAIRRGPTLEYPLSRHNLWELSAGSASISIHSPGGFSRIKGELVLSESLRGWRALSRELLYLVAAPANQQTLPSSEYWTAAIVHTNEPLRLSSVRRADESRPFAT